MVNEQAPDTVKCIITQEIKTSGAFDLYVAAFKDRSWFKETATQITVYDRPELVTIKPKVIFNFSLVENLELTGVNLVPYLITSVVFNGVRKVDPVFKDGKIIIGDIPMNNRKDYKYLVVQIETIFGYLTTPLLVLYSDQLQIDGLLNEGDSLVTQGVCNLTLMILWLVIIIIIRATSLILLTILAAMMSAYNRAWFICFLNLFLISIVPDNKGMLTVITSCFMCFGNVLFGLSHWIFAMNYFTLAVRLHYPKEEFD